MLHNTKSLRHKRHNGTMNSHLFQLHGMPGGLTGGGVAGPTHVADSFFQGLVLGCSEHEGDSIK